MHPIEIPERPKLPPQRWSVRTAVIWGAGLKLCGAFIALCNAITVIQHGGTWDPAFPPLAFVTAEVLGCLLWAGIFAGVAVIRNAFLPKRLT